MSARRPRSTTHAWQLSCRKQGPARPRTPAHRRSSCRSDLACGAPRRGGRWPGPGAAPCARGAASLWAGSTAHASLSCACCTGCGCGAPAQHFGQDRRAQASHAGSRSLPQSHCMGCRAGRVQAPYLLGRAPQPVQHGLLGDVVHARAQVRAGAQVNQPEAPRPLHPEDVGGLDVPARSLSVSKQRRGAERVRQSVSGGTGAKLEAGRGGCSA